MPMHSENYPKLAWPISIVIYEMINGIRPKIKMLLPKNKNKNAKERMKGKMGNLEIMDCGPNPELGLCLSAIALEIHIQSPFLSVNPNFYQAPLPSASIFSSPLDNHFMTSSPTTSLTTYDPKALRNSPQCSIYTLYRNYDIIHL